MLRDAQAGFVLPAVLAFIAAFTFIIVTTALTLERSRDLATALQRQQDLAAALDATEANATFLFITSRPVPNGILLLPDALSATDVLMGGESAPVSENSQIWEADGGLLVFETDPYRSWAIYRDTDGLVSLSTADEAVIGRLLQGFGASAANAALLSARLKDYQDEDRIRRPMGAERADYRLRQRPLPSDSPLRSPAELGRVWGWEDLDFVNDVEFLSNVTAAFGTDRPLPRFATDRLRVLLAELPGRDEATADILIQAAGVRLVPSGRGRFILGAQDIRSGEMKIRLVEIERRPTAASAPYSRALIAEFTDPEIPESWIPNENAKILASSEP